MKALQFRVTGVPVRVEPLFFVTMGLLGWANGHAGLLILEFVVVGGASILVHELGHAGAYRSFGAHPRVTLMGFGGVTMGEAQSRGRSLVVTLAGPGAGFLAALVGVALTRVVQSDSTLVTTALEDLVWVNVLWGVFNLLPILPLDGGNVAAGLFGHGPARVLSIAGAAGLALLGFYARQPFLTLIGFWFGAQNLQTLSSDRDRPQLEVLDEVRGHILRGENPAAVERIGPIAAAPASWRVEVTAAELLAWAGLAEGEPEKARAALAGLRSGVSGTSALVRRIVEVASGDDAAPIAPAFVLCDDVVAATVAARIVGQVGLVDRVLDELRTLPPAPGPPVTNGYRALQLGLHHAGRYQESARVGATLFQREPAALVAYNVACSQALAGDTEDAVAWLDRAVERGFRDTQLLDGDANFDAIRATDGFRALRSWMESGPPGEDPEAATAD